jgi:hypothetical protein
MRPVPIAPTLIRLPGDVAPKTEEGTMAGKPARRGLPLLRRAGPHQPRALPQRPRAPALRRDPEHPRAFDADRDLPGFDPYYPGGGGYAGLVYNVAYTKAMLQAALSG